MNAEFERMRLHLADSQRREIEFAAKQVRRKMWLDMGGMMIGQAISAQSVILNPNVPLPEAVKLAESGFQRFMGLAEQAFAEAAK